MWIVVMGATCTGKQAIIKELVTSFEFQHLNPEEPTNQLDLFGHRLATQIEAQRLGQNRLIVTNRSVWDTCEVMLDYGVKFNKITKPTADGIKRIYQKINNPNTLLAPSAVMWAKLDGMSASDFALLKGTEITHEEFVFQSELYEKLARKIAIPLVEVNMTNMGEAIREINFMVNSLKSSGLSTNSAWKKDMFL